MADLLSGAMGVLDLPASMLRDVMALNNPFDQLLTPFDPNKNRLSGRDVMERWGAAPNDPNKWEAADIGGLALDFLDPAMFIPVAGPGLKAASMGGKALKTGLKAATKAPKSLLSSNLVKRAGNIDWNKLFNLDNAMTLFKKPEPITGLVEGLVEGMPNIPLTPTAAMPETAVAGYLPAPKDYPFYSRLVRASEGLTGKNIKAQGLRNRLDKTGYHVSDDEWRAMGMDDLLKEKKTITKDELMQHIRTQDSPLRIRRLKKPLWEDYSTPGGTDYRETILQSGRELRDPQIEQLVQHAQNKIDSVGDDKLFRSWARDESVKHISDTLGIPYADADQLLKTPRRLLQHDDTHFEAFPNTVAHLRQTNRLTPTGGKRLHAEEFQSDLWQSVRKHDRRVAAAEHADLYVLDGPFDGFSVGGKLKIGKKLYTIKEPEVFPTKRSAEYAIEKLKSSPHEILKAFGLPTNPVPNRFRQLPLSTTWDERLLQQHIVDAVKGGYDELSWNSGRAIFDVVAPGETEDILKGMQAAYDKRFPDMFNKMAKKRDWKTSASRFTGRTPPPTTLDDFTKRLDDDKTSFLRDADVNAADVAVVNSLSDEMVVRAENGEPLKSLYSEWAEKVLGEYPRESGWRVKITPEMIKDVMTKGFPMLGLGAVATAMGLQGDKDAKQDREAT